MNFTSATLSQGCIRELYTKNKCEIRYPWVQILDFEESQVNEKEIIIRISDGLHFIDCTLSGNYIISNNAIIETKNATTVTTFKKYHIVKIDFFSKIDENRICKLKIMIRKMNDAYNWNEIVGSPQQIQQFMVNSKKAPISQFEQTVKKGKEEKEPELPNSSKQENVGCIKLESVMEVQTQMFSLPPPISQPSKPQKKEAFFPADSASYQGANESLTLNQILGGKQGFLIGRLIRFKSTRKDTKDGPMSVCYLGVVDKHGQLIRIHLAGRLAMNNEKNLKKGKSYYIRGFDIVNLKNTGPQIRLKDKEYKIVEIHNEELTKQLSFQYFKWDHEAEAQNGQSQFVDVIGMVDDIEKKATYTPYNETKSVIRIVIKNRFKSIKISFWTDQIKNFETFNLKKKECIIIEDIRKKHSKYYDFSFESSLIHLHEFPFLQDRFKDIFPVVTEQISPENIKELQKLIQDDPSNTKLQTIRAHLINFKDNKLIYHLCDDCKKKVEKTANECQECGSENLVYKYNCPLEFSDNTGSIVVILFDAAAQKLIGKTANEINELSEEETEHIFESLVYKYYLISIENRNQRFILRNIEIIDQNQEVGQLRQNLQKINNHVLREIW